MNIHSMNLVFCCGNFPMEFQAIYRTTSIALRLCISDALNVSDFQIETTQLELKKMWQSFRK